MIEELMVKSPVFFMGASSAKGFYSCFNDIYSPEKADRLYILKGGPGTGKSTLMKKIALEMEKKGERCEFGICSSDPDSLDVLSINSLNCSICDGTAPHVMDPVYPGVSEIIVSLGDFFDRRKLMENKSDIIENCIANSQMHKKTTRYITAAASLLDDSYNIACEATNFDAVVSYTKRFAETIIPELSIDEDPENTKRIISAITSKGHIFLMNTLNVMCDEIYVIEDEFGSVSSTMLNTILEIAGKKGQKAIICPCPITPTRKIDHLILPDARIAFCTENKYLIAENKTARVTHAKRFMNPSAIKEHRPRLSFNRRAVQELLDGAVNFLKEAKAIHDKIEKYYIDAMDFSAVEKVTNRIINEINELKSL